jgi:hypothetical protein
LGIEERIYQHARALWLGTEARLNQHARALWLEIEERLTLSTNIRYVYVLGNLLVTYNLMLIALANVSSTVQWKGHQSRRRLPACWGVVVGDKGKA